MRKLTKKKALILVVLFSFSILGLGELYPDVHRYLDHEHLKKAEEPLDSNLATFSSNVPIVVIDLGEQSLPSLVWLDPSPERYFRAATLPDARATMKIYANDQERINHRSDIPEVETLIDLHVRGNTSSRFVKHQYNIKLLNDDESNKSENILGMGKEHEWILNISQIDKSLLRNYIAYNTAGELMSTSPDVRFCEVIIRENGVEEYLGVYLMMESVAKGPTRVPIPSYDQRMSDPYYIVQRDRWTPNHVQLHTYAWENGLVESNLSIKYPSKTEISAKHIEMINNEISAFEEALYSEDHDVFFNYRDYINVDTFVDYFIINEFFGNYDAGIHSTYMYKDLNGKFSMGPVWDFDGDIDNYFKEAGDPNKIVIQYYPYFKRMIIDKWFVDRLESRYKALRKDVLSDEHLFAQMDHVRDVLDQAIARDWEKWGSYYTKDYLIGRDDTQSAEEELTKMKTWITAHGAYLDQNIRNLYVEASEQDDSHLKLDAWAVVFIFAFIMSVIIIRRDM